MRTAADRSKDRRSFRLEALEDRNLLSAIKPPAIAAEVFHATATTITSISGKIQGQSATAGLMAPTTYGYHSQSGHGYAKPLHNVYLGTQQLNALDSTGTKLTITNGSAVLTAIKGDELQIAYTGTGQIPKKGRTTFQLTGSVLSGTGRFTNATGTFTSTGTTDGAKYNLSFQITLNPKSWTGRLT